MKEVAIQNHQPTLPKQYKAAVYLRVNSPDKVEEGTQSKQSKTALYCRVASRHPNDAGAMQIQLNKTS